jgi:hypothetical protein
MSDMKIYNGADININYTASATVRLFGKIRNLVSFLALALMLAFGSSDASALPAPTPNPNMEMGIVTGGIYSWRSADEPAIINQPLLDYADQIFSEFKGMGGKWVRIEANWKDNYDGQYTFIADKAHSYGLKVIVVVTAGKKGPYCTWNGSRDEWLNDYVAELNRLATQVFFKRGLLNAQADAFEIMNEPNQFDSSALECTGTGRFRMDGDSFAWLLRFVWNWKNSAQRPEKIISGGTISTYYNSPTEPWWNQFFASGAFFPVYGARPFDYFGVHPYNDFTPAGTWQTETQQMLVGLAAKLDIVTRASGTRLFATEVGDYRASRMQEAINACRNSGVVEAALWYDYRDDHPGGFGLRYGWNGTSHPAKIDMWSKFKTLAGGTGSNDPEYYWYTAPLNRAPYGVLDYANTTSIGGWAYDPDTVLPVNVYIYIDGNYVGSTLANTSRPDLVAAGVAANHAHGFYFPTPSYLSPGCHTVTALSENFRGGSNTQLTSTKQICK